MRPPRRFRADRRAETGAAVVEFSLVLPLLLALVAAVFFWGLYFAHGAMLTRATEVAARAVALPADPLAGPSSRYRTTDEVVEVARSTARFLDPASLTVTIEPENPREGQAFLVTTTYTYETVSAPLLRILGAEAAEGAVVLTSTAQGVRE